MTMTSKSTTHAAKSHPWGADITPAGLAKTCGYNLPYTTRTAKEQREAGRKRRVDPSDIIGMNNDELEAHCNAHAALLAALQRLYDCPDVNLDSLEDETIEALEQARAALALA